VIHPVTRERIAYWGEVIVACSMTIVAIVVASQLGYREALNFARLEEQREEFNAMRSMERELASNENAIRRALDDWSGNSMRFLHVVTASYDRAKESDAYFRLDPETASELSGIYGGWVPRTIEGIRKHGPGPIFRVYAANLELTLEKIERARPLVARDVARLAAQLKAAGVEDPMTEIAWPVEPVPAPTATETEAMNRRTTDGWTRGAPPEYKGALAPFHIGRYTAIAARPRGPVLLRFKNSRPPEGRRPVRLWLAFSDRAPTDRAHTPGQDDDDLRKFFACGGASFVLSIPWTEWQADILDPNQPAGWRWAYGFLEDDAGDRHFLYMFEAWKIAGGPKDVAWGHFAEPSDGALVLPKGYLKQPG